jgi:hypothetical protein
MNEHDDDELPLKLARNVELIDYVKDHQQSFAILEAHELLAVFEETLSNINAEIEAGLDIPAIFVDILPCPAEQLLFGVTLIYTGSADFRGSMAIAKYSGSQDAAHEVLFEFCQCNALVELKDFLGSPAAATGLN